MSAPSTPPRAPSRATDKFVGRNIADLTLAEQAEFYAAISERGAYSALKRLGLDDQYAGQDIKDLRDILKAYRIVKKATWTGVLTGLGRIISWMLFLIVAGWFVHNADPKKVMDILGP